MVCRPFDPRTASSRGIDFEAPLEAPTRIVEPFEPVKTDAFTVPRQRIPRILSQSLIVGVQRLPTDPFRLRRVGESHRFPA